MGNMGMLHRRCGHCVSSRMGNRRKVYDSQLRLQEFSRALQTEQHRRDPRERDRHVALDDLVVAACGKLVPGDLLLAARPRVRAVRHRRRTDLDEPRPVTNLVVEPAIMLERWHDTDRKVRRDAAAKLKESYG